MLCFCFVPQNRSISPLHAFHGLERESFPSGFQYEGSKVLFFILTLTQHLCLTMLICLFENQKMSSKKKIFSSFYLLKNTYWNMILFMLSVGALKLSKCLVYTKCLFYVCCNSQWSGKLVSKIKQRRID